MGRSKGALVLLALALGACGAEQPGAQQTDDTGPGAQSSAKGTEASTDELFNAERPKVAIVNGEQGMTVMAKHRAHGMEILEVVHG